MDMITGHHVDKIELKEYDGDNTPLNLKVSYDFCEHYQRYLLTLDSQYSFSKASARKLRDFLNGLSLEGRG